MSKKIQKIIGWLLILAGVGIISWSLWSSYNIFTNKSQAPQIFKIEEQEVLNQPKTQKNQSIEAQMQERINETIGEQFKKMLPANLIPQIFNLMSWSIFSGILIFGGTQLATIGIKFIKENS